MENAESLIFLFSLQKQASRPDAGRENGGKRPRADAVERLTFGVRVNFFRFVAQQERLAGIDFFFRLRFASELRNEIGKAGLFFPFRVESGRVVLGF